MKKSMLWIFLTGLIFIWAGCEGGGTPNLLQDGQGYEEDIQDTQEAAGLDLLSDQESSEIEQRCIPGSECDDHNPCTINDMCSDDGICKGTMVEGCDDGLKCTFDSCKSEKDCTHTLKNGWCLINGKCYKEGESSPDNQCMACITAVATDRFVPDDTKSCEDGDECTKGDHCEAGKCVSGPVDCDDGNPCTKDYCDNGKCIHEPVDGGSCDDNNICTTGDHCVQGQCMGEQTVDCDDGNPCTKDSCDPQKGCVHTPVEGSCDDGNKCTTNDHCENGVCKGDLLDCDDGNICTDDSCVPSKGCVHIPNTAPCDDGDPCTVGDTCYAGKCKGGDKTPDCDDGNPCTKDFCKPKVGCQNVPVDDTSIPCDDGDVCTIGDHCGKGTGKCVAGPTMKNCDDGNPCTKDLCDAQKGCYHKNVKDGLACNDQNICTVHDVCKAGKCQGSPRNCDDGNECTLDACSAEHGGCYYTADLSKPECRPSIQIDFPPRGATLGPADTTDHKGHIVVRGKVILPTAPTGKLIKFTINSNPVVPKSDGSFTFPMDSLQGMNTIVIDAEDSLGVKQHIVQSYYYSNRYLAMTNQSNSLVANGLMMFLGRDVWNKFSKIVVKYINNIDINSMISNPVATKKIGSGWLSCKYKIYVENIRFDKSRTTLSLTPQNGYLALHGAIYDLKADIHARSKCPDFNGSATIDWITIDTKLYITVDSNGNPKVTTQDVTVNMAKPKLHGSGLFSKIVAWLANTFFGNTFKKSLANGIKSAIVGQIGPALANALKSLNLDKDFDVPSMLPGQKPVKVHIKTRLSAFVFKTSGSTVKMHTMISAPKDPNLGHNIKGSITRSGCCKGLGDSITMPVTSNPLELGMHDDMINQIPFAMYWGGSLKFDMTDKDLGQDLSQYNIKNLVLHIDFWLPPIITGCKRSGNKIRVEIGDIGIHATMDMMGMPVDAQMYASAAFDADFEITQDNKITITIKDIAFLDLQVASINDELVGQESMIRDLVLQQMLPQVIDKIVGKSLGSFPIPEIDLHQMDSSIPAGTKIKLVPRVIVRKGAYTVMGGRLDVPNF